MNNPGNMRRELRRRGILLKKSLGQIFLEDADLLGKLVETAGIKKGEAVLEIGPGAGALTAGLLDAGARVLAVEIDGRMTDILQERFGGREGFFHRHADFLKLPEEAVEEFADGERIKVVANLPYYNASRILLRLSRWRRHFGLCVLTLQKELAERLAARPNTKAYGALTLKVCALAEVDSPFALPAQAFFPRPKVDSRAVVIDFTKPSLPDDLPYNIFARCVGAAFSTRRKMLPNALASTYGKDAAIRGLTQCEIDLSARAEDIDLEGFYRLSKALTG